MDAVCRALKAVTVARTVGEAAIRSQKSLVFLRLAVTPRDAVMADERNYSYDDDDADPNANQCYGALPRPLPLRSLISTIHCTIACCKRKSLDLDFG